MKFNDETNRYTLASGRIVCGFMDMLSVDGRGVLHYGSDGKVDEDKEQPFTAEERKEIAAHFIERWLTWAGAMPAGCTLHPTALETCEDCPRVDLHVAVSLTPGAARELMMAPRAT